MYIYIYMFMYSTYACTWVVVKIMVLSMIRHLVFRGPKRGP